MRCIFILLLLLGGGCESPDAGSKAPIESQTQQVEPETSWQASSAGVPSKPSAPTDPVSEVGQQSASLVGEGNSVRLETKEGTVAARTNTVPKNFPLPIIDKAHVRSSTHLATPNRGNTYLLKLMVDKSATDIADFYEQALRNKGLSVERNEHTQGHDEMVMLVSRTPHTDAAVSIRKGERRESVDVTINWRAR